MNASGVTIDTNGWKILASDSYSDINVVNPVAWDLPTSILPYDSEDPSTILYRTDDPGDNYWGADLNWAPNENGWVMIIDDAGNVIDFAVWGNSQTQTIIDSQAHNGSFEDVILGSETHRTDNTTGWSKSDTGWSMFTINTYVPNSVSDGLWGLSVNTGVYAEVTSDPITTPNPSFPNVVNVTIEGNYTLHAVFDYKLTVSRNCAGGTIVTPGLGVYRKVRTATAGTIDIQAVADDGYEFDKWSGSAVTEGRVADENNPITTVTMDRDCTVEGCFKIKQYNLVISVDGSDGTLLTPSAGTHPYIYGTKVPIAAQANPGYHFAGWTGTAVDARKVKNPASPDTTVLMAGKRLAADGQFTLMATFAANEYLLDVSSSQGGYVDVDGDELADEGIVQYSQISPVNIQAYADADYVFTGWDGSALSAGKIEDPVSASTIVTVNGCYTLKAIFAPVNPTVIYVSPHGDDTDGASWQTAFNKLQDALDIAVAGNQIWVAAGTYYPDEGQGQTDNLRTSTFALIDGVQIYGGFSGDETSLSQRDMGVNVTILSGNIKGDDTDNSYHVVTAVTGSYLDGFTITKGNANDSSDPHDRGGGIYCGSATSLTIANCIIQGNQATQYGGGMFNGLNGYVSTPILYNCVFNGNTASVNGGGLYNKYSGSHTTLINCTFVNNTATAGGAIFNFQGNITMTNGIVYDNTSPAIHPTSATTVTYSLVEGNPGTPQSPDVNGNFGGDPKFTDSDTSDYSLSADSPCIDVGNNNVIPAYINTDLDGKSRQYDDPATPDEGNGTAPIVDMGAYEFQPELNNEPPVAVDDSFEFVDDDPATAETVFIPFADLLQNDEDTDNDTLTVHSVSDLSSGTLDSVPAEERYEYTPDFPDTGTATFTYKVFDSTTLSNEATVTIDIREPGALKVEAGGPYVYILEDQQLSIEVPLADAQVTGDNADSASVEWAEKYLPLQDSIVWEGDEATQKNPTITIELADLDLFDYFSEVTYVLELTATEGARQASDQLFITILPGSNNMPLRVDAGSYDPLTTWPNDNSVSLDGTAADDGLPYGVLYYRWTVVDAPEDTVIFEDPFAEDTTVTFTGQGRYTLRLSVTDLETIGFDETVIAVGDQGASMNEPPMVDILENDGNDDGEISINSGEYVLATDVWDEEPDQLTYTWSVLPVAGTSVNGVSFSGIHDSQPTATFTKSGKYQIQVEVFDGQYSATDSIRITVNNPGGDYTLKLSAGPDKEIQLPAIAHLVGDAWKENTDGDQKSFTEEDLFNLDVWWSLLDGPARVTFVDDSKDQLYGKAEFTEPGTYTFRLEGRFYGFPGPVDDVQVEVKPLKIIVDSSKTHTLVVDDSIHAKLWSCGSNATCQLGQPIDCEWDESLNSGYYSRSNGDWTCLHDDRSSIFRPVLPALDQDSVGYPLSLLPDDQLFTTRLDYNECLEQFNSVVGICSPPREGCVSVALDKYGHVWAWGMIGAFNEFIDGEVWFSEQNPNPYFRYCLEDSQGFGRKIAPLPIVQGYQSCDQPWDSKLLENIVSIDHSYNQLGAWKYAVESNSEVWWWTEEHHGPFSPARLIDISTSEPFRNIIDVAALKDRGQLFLLENMGIDGKIFYHYYNLYTNIVPAPDLNENGELETSETGTYGSEYLRKIVEITSAGDGDDFGIALEAIDPVNNCSGQVYTWGCKLTPSFLYGNTSTFVDQNGSVFPVRVRNIDDSGYLENIVDIASNASNHVMALDTDGIVYAWGYNDYGQLGVGDTVNRGIPVKVVAPDLDDDGNPDVAEYGSSHLRDIVAIYAGASSSFAVDKDGRLFAWGDNSCEKLGLGETGQLYFAVPREVPFQKTVHNVTAGTWHHGIQEAINAAENDDHIIIHPKVYYESIKFSDEDDNLKNILLTSEDPTDPDIVQSTIIRGSITIDSDSGSSLTSVVSGFTITGGTGGIVVTGTDTEPINDAIYLTNNIIRDISGQGIDVDYANSVHILDNWIVENSAGIAINNSYAVIRNNTIVGNSGIGIDADSGNTSRVLNNIIYNNGTEIFGIDASDCYFCCIGGISETPDGNWNFGTNPAFVMLGYMDDNEKF